MQQKKVISVVGFLSLMTICFCCCSAALFMEGSFLPFKACRPINYPFGTRDGLKEGEWFSLTTPDTMSEVLSFYDQRLLDGQEFPRNLDVGEWQRKELADGKWLYSCYGVDINHTTTETGCIYVSEQAEGVLITSDFFRSEGANTPCQQ